MTEPYEPTLEPLSVEDTTSHENSDPPSASEPSENSAEGVGCEEEPTRLGEEADEEREEEMYTRGRSRSRSVHEYDDPSDSNVVNIVPPIDPSGYMGKGPAGDARNEKSASVERTGPLQQREVVALKKGLEEHAQTRNHDQVQEEEEERRAAAVEKQSRTTVSSAAAAIGAEPPLRRVKILMLGDSGVGKSSLINRWTMDTFSPTLVSTVGVDFKAKKVALDGENLNVQVWDTAGQEHFHKITQSYYKGANGIMLIFDVSDKLTLENVEYWVKNIKKHALDSVHVALVGNKTDLRDGSDKCCDSDAGRNVALKFGVPYFETSAKEAVNVDEAFLTVLRCIVTGESLLKQTTEAKGGKTKSKSFASRLEKTGSSAGLSLFSGLGKSKDKDKKGASGGGSGNSSGDETASIDSTSSNSSTSSNGGFNSKYDDGKECIIS